MAGQTKANRFEFSINNCQKKISLRVIVYLLSYKRFFRGLSKTLHLYVVITIIAFTKGSFQIRSIVDRTISLTVRFHINKKCDQRVLHFVTQVVSKAHQDKVILAGLQNSFPKNHIFMQ